MSEAFTEHEGDLTSTTQTLDHAIDAHHAQNEPDDSTTASSAAEEPLNIQTSSMGGFTSYEIAHRYFPVSATARQIVTRFLRNPTASYYKLIKNLYVGAMSTEVWLLPRHLEDFNPETYSFEEQPDIDENEDEDFTTIGPRVALLQKVKTLVRPCFVDYTNIRGPTLALEPSVITEQVGAESILVSKLFHERSRQIIAKVGATSEAISVLNSALNHGVGTSLAGPLCTLLTAFATNLDSLSQMHNSEYVAPLKIVCHRDTFQSSWRSQASFSIWISSGWFTTTQSHYIELTDELLHKPDQAALWLFALTLRRVAFHTLHLYNCPIEAESITISGSGEIEVVDGESQPNSQSGADASDLEEESPLDDASQPDSVDEPEASAEDVLWAVTLASRLASLYGHVDHPLDVPVMERALGQVLRWAQHLVAGSGSMTAAYKLMALTSYTKFSECESDEGKKCPNIHLNCFNATPGSTIAECGPVNPLVLWAYMNKMIALDPGEEPLPLNTTSHGVGMMATMFNIAMRTHSELATSAVGLDIYYTLCALPTTRDSELRFHHQQLALGAIDSLAPVLTGSGIRVKVGDPDTPVSQLYSTLIGCYVRDKLCLATNTIPLWLISVLSGETQVVPSRGDVSVSRVVAPPPVTGDSLDDMATETTNQSVFWTWGQAYPRSPDLYTYIDRRFDKPSMLCARAYVHNDVYNMDTYDQTATMMIVPKHYLYSTEVRTFALTPHDCTSECVSPLTHMRIPQGAIPVRDRPPMMLGDATSLLNSAFRRDVDGSH